jgi:hypothetical protein
MQPENKLIEHLSKEIETQTDNLMTFRTRVSFAALIGPFFLLGSLLVAAKRIPKASNGWLITGGLLLMILSYLTLGWAASSIERHTWRQCNVWRGLIAEVFCGNNSNVTAERLRFDEKLRLGYLVSYSAMALAFGSAVLIIRYLTLVE